MLRYKELLAYIIEHGKQVNNTIELMGVQLEVDDWCLYDFPGIRSLAVTNKYLLPEICWYLSCNRDASLIAPYAKLWNEIKNEDGTANSNYGYLVFKGYSAHPSMDKAIFTPFGWAATRLEQDHTSRKAVITYNTGGYNFEDNKDYICSQHQAFYIRQNRLLCYVALRSSDSVWGLTYNMPWWNLVYRQMYNRLRQKYSWLKPDVINVTIYSSHIYNRHIDLVKKMLSSNYSTYRLKIPNTIPVYNDFNWYLKNLKLYKHGEEFILKVK